MRARDLLLLLGAGYLALRLPFAARMPTFFDEALYAAESNTALHHASALFIGAPYARPPLHTWLAMPPIALGIPGIAAVRIVSIVAGLVTLSVVVALGRRLGGAATAAAAGVLYVVVPYFVVGDVVGVVDPVLTAAGMLALLLSIRLAEGAPWTGVELGLALMAGVMTKLTALIALVLAPLGLLFFDWRPAGRRPRVLRWTRGMLAATLLVGCGLAINKLGAPEVSVTQSESGLLVHRPVSEILGDPLAGLHDNGPLVWAAFRGYMTIPVLLLALLGVAVATGRSRRLALILVVWSAAVIAAAIFAVYVPYPRYLMMGMPPLVVLAGHGLSLAARSVAVRLPRSRTALVTATVVVLVAIPAVRLDSQFIAKPATAPYPGHDRSQYVTGFGAGSGWKGIARTLRDRSGPGTTVITFGSVSPLQLAFHLGLPSIEHHKRGVAWREPLTVVDGSRRWFFVGITDPRSRNAGFLVRQTAALQVHRLPLRRYKVVADFTTPEGLATNQLMQLRSSP